MPVQGRHPPGVNGTAGKEKIAGLPMIHQKCREMFSKLSSKSGRRFICPNCGVGYDGNPERGTQVIECADCGTKASVAEWTQRPGENSVVGRAGRPPAETRIRRESALDGSAWHIPAHGKFGFLLFFGVLWTLLTAVVSGGFLLAILTGGEIKGNMPKWALIPFFGVFWAIGLIFLYFGVRQKWMSYRLTVGHGELVLSREMFGRSKEKRLPLSDITGIEQKEFYQQNYEPVFGIEIKAARGKLRFGSALDAGEKAWLVADLREAVFGLVQPDRMLADQPRPGLQHNQVFSVEIPNASKHLWPLAIVTGLLGAVFLVVSMTFLKEPWEMGKNKDSVMIRVFDSLFNVLGHDMQAVFFLMGVALLTGGVALVVHFIRNQGTVRKLEGNSLEIAIRTYRNNLVWKEKTYPRSMITDIRASQSGSSGSTIMKRIELIAGDEVIKLASWVDGNAADAVVEQVRSGL